MVNKNRLYWTLQIGGWFFYAALQIVFSMLASGGISQRGVIFLLSEAALCLLITHFFRYFLSRWKWLFLGMARLIPRVILSVFLLGLVTYFFKMPVSMLLGLFDGYNKSLKYEASMIEIELNNLKAQLNPHFIFNALNSIRALVDENPIKSKQAINQLSNILRNSLASDKKGLTKFDDELKIVKDYLGLESIRFEERLKTEFDIHPNSHNFLVPPLMIQTLVENGIKHGISKLTPGGTIQVKTLVEKNRLKIQIRNSGHMINGTKRSNKGLGLKNTVQRLKLIYADEASFRMVNESDNFVLTEITIPQTNTDESINRR